MEHPLVPSLWWNVPFDIGWYNTAHFDPTKTGKSHHKTPTGAVAISGTPTQQIISFSTKKEMIRVEGWGGKGKRETEIMR